MRAATRWVRQTARDDHGGSRVTDKYRRLFQVERRALCHADFVSGRNVLAGASSAVNGCNEHFSITLQTASWKGAVESVKRYRGVPASTWIVPGYSTPRIGPRVRQTIRNPGGRLSRFPSTKNDAT